MAWRTYFTPANRGGEITKSATHLSRSYGPSKIVAMSKSLAHENLSAAIEALEARILTIRDSL
jgi:hypothetical protein